MPRSLPLLFVLLVAIVAQAAERSESFDREPAWDARNNRATEPPVATIRQDFGHSQTSHAGGKPGEIGGYISPAGEAAYYATPIAAATFDTPLSASGTFACNEQGFHVLLGFFNADAKNEWRTPNSIALRLNGRGDVFYAYVEYCTARWRAGGDSPRGFPTRQNPQTGRQEIIGFPVKNQVHRWSLKYDPRGNDGHGAITATIDDQTAVCHLEAAHRADGAKFNRFGLMTVMKSADGGGEVWIDDITLNGGPLVDFSRDPGWEGFQNRRTYQSTIVRPRFDFGYSPTNFAGGRAVGELGGLVFRGDCRYPGRMACYADRLEELSLDKPLRASGKVALKRGVTDSGVLLGYFNSQESMRSNPAQDTGLPASFFGISTDAPSREGFYFSPTYRLTGDSRGTADPSQPLYLYPDGKPHDWTFDYSPTAADGNGQITVTLDERSIKLPLQPGQKAAGTRFDRFGLITAWVDGNSQNIYFDDLRYTSGQ